LNDLYVRFFRMAERRIVEKTGEGIVCFISNYSWLDGLSFTGMRERYLEVFDKIWIDCLNGDKYKTGKLTPDGKPDPSIFSTEHNREGIQVGTAMSLMARRKPTGSAHTLLFKNFWGTSKREELLHSLLEDTSTRYETLAPRIGVGLPFVPASFAEAYLLWPSLPELFPFSSPGVTTSLDDFVIDCDRSSLEARIAMYFDESVSDEEIRRIAPSALAKTHRFDSVVTRRRLMARGFLRENIVRYAYRPLDLRWLYWEPETDLIERKRLEFLPNVVSGNLWLEGRQRTPNDSFDRGYVTRVLSDNFGNGLSNFFPLMKPRGQTGSLFHSASEREGGLATYNLSEHAAHYISSIGNRPEDLFLLAVGMLRAPLFAADNDGALRRDWPRIPLPDSKELLLASAELGRKVADLLDPETEVDGVTSGSLRPELRVIGVASRVGGGNLNEGTGDLAVTAGWGHAGQGGVTMPGKGKAITRPWTSEELAAIGQGAEALGLSAEEALAQLGDQAVDVYLNDVAYWRGVPSGVWSYTVGGYQVMKTAESMASSRRIGLVSSPYISKPRNGKGPSADPRFSSSRVPLMARGPGKASSSLLLASRPRPGSTPSAPPPSASFSSTAPSWRS
jgi:hypothetical protein